MSIDTLDGDELFSCRKGKPLKCVKGVVEYGGRYYRESKHTYCNCGHIQCDSASLVQYSTYRRHLKRQKLNCASSSREYSGPADPVWLYKYRQLTRSEIADARKVLTDRKRLRRAAPMTSSCEDWTCDFGMDDYGGGSPCPSDTNEVIQHEERQIVHPDNHIGEDDWVGEADDVCPVARVKDELSGLMQHTVPKTYFLSALRAWIKNTTPLAHINEELERMQPWNEVFNVPVIPDQKKMRRIMRMLNPGYQKLFTCRHHHDLIRSGRSHQYPCTHEGCSAPRDRCIRYSSVRDAITRLLQNPHFRTEVQKSVHNSRQSRTTCTDIWSAEFVKDMRAKHPSFFRANDGYTPLLFGLFVDGFRVSQASYTAGAVVLVCFNLPADIRMDAKNLQLLQLIDGPTEPDAKGWQRYLGQIVDEFQHLMEGFVIYGEKYRAALICTMQDGRATKKTSMLDEAGSKDACIKCTVQREENTGSSQCYSSRGNLEPGDPLRGQFPCVWREKDDDFIRARRRMDETLRNQLPSLAAGVTGESVFERLPYWDSSRCHLLCFMHTIKNFGSHLEKLVEGEKENPATRRLLFQKGFLNMASHSHLRVHQDSKGRDKIPRTRPPWMFNPDLQHPLNSYTATQFLKTVLPPSRLCIQPSRLFRKTQQAIEATGKSVSGQKDIGAKSTGESAPMKQFLFSGIFSYVLYIGGVDPEIARALDKLLSLLNKLLAPTVNLTKLDALGQEIWRALVQLENNLPLHCLPLCIHNIGHLSRQVKDFGPISGYHSYPLESYLGDLKGMNLNPAHPTAAIFERIMRDYAMETLIDLLSDGDVLDNLAPKFRDDVVLQEPAPSTQARDISMREMESIKKYIETNWEEYPKLQCQSRHVCLWTFGDGLSVDQRSKYSGRQRKILEGIRGTVTRFKAFQINQTRFSIKDGLKREDRVVFYGCKVGILKEIINLEVRLLKSHDTSSEHPTTHRFFGIMQYYHGVDEIFLIVDELVHVERHAHLSQRTGVTHCDSNLKCLQPTDITGQGFLAVDVENADDTIKKYVIFSSGYLRKADSM